MPIYEYKCLKCEEVFDYILIKTDDEGPSECELCGHDSVEKIMSSGSFSMELSAMEQLEQKTLPGIRKDTRDILNGDETKMVDMLGEKKATQIVKDRKRGERVLDAIKKSS